jgi:hypothetical protein
VLRTIAPVPPTATQVLGRGQATSSRRVLGAPKVWLRQVRPPFAVRRIVPLSPTVVPTHPRATQRLGLGQATAPRLSGVPLGWRCQVLPPFAVRRIVPLYVVMLAPTATQVLGLGQATALRRLVVLLVWLLAAGRADKRPPSGGATSTGPGPEEGPMHYRFALAALYAMVVATVAATLLFGLNPAIITAVPLPVATLATVTLVRCRGRRQEDRARGTSGDEHNV